MLIDQWGNMLANSAFSSTVIDGFSVANSTDPGSFSAVYGYLTEQLSMLIVYTNRPESDCEA